MDFDIKVSKNLLELAKLFGSEHSLYIVGGYVRNALLGQYNTDIDLASDLTPDEVRQCVAPFGYKVLNKSLKMGTIVIVKDSEEYEHTTFRKETYLKNKHQPDIVKLKASIREDAMRRDFTANCLYYDIIKKNIVDFYSGVKDILKSELKAVETPSYVFSVDGLRILRMVRLACELGFHINIDTFNEAKNNLDHLKNISGERKYAELVKILNSQNKYSFSPNNAYEIGLNLLNKLDAWDNIFNLGNFQLPKSYFSTNIYGLILNIYRNFKNLSFDEFVCRTFGQKALNRSKKEQRLLKNLLFACYGFTHNKWEDFVNIYPHLDEILGILKLINITLCNKLMSMKAEAISRKTPLTLKDLQLTSIDLAKVNVDKSKYSYYLNKLWRITIRYPHLNDKNILINYILKKEKIC